MPEPKEGQGDNSGQQSQQGTTDNNAGTETTSKNFELTDNFAKKSLDPKDLRKT